jgi:hypothetical protein
MGEECGVAVGGRLVQSWYSAWSAITRVVTVGTWVGSAASEVRRLDDPAVPVEAAEPLGPPQPASDTASDTVTSAARSPIAALGDLIVVISSLEVQVVSALLTRRRRCGRR